MRFVIPGNPIPKARPRFSSGRGNVVAFDSQTLKKQFVRRELTKQFKEMMSHHPECVEYGKFASGSSFSVKFTFYIEIAGSSTEGERNEKLWGLIPCNQKPDLDNLEKFYLDCLNSIIYSDDKLVTSLQSKKYYSSKPRTIIEIEMDENKVNDNISEVLKLFSPDTLINFLEDVTPLLNLFLVTRNVEDQIIEIMQKVDEDEQNLNVITMAYCMSKIAEKYGKLLSKIKTRCPDLYLQFDKIAEQERKKRIQNGRGDTNGES